MTASFSCVSFGLYHHSEVVAETLLTKIVCRQATSQSASQPASQADGRTDRERDVQ